MIPKPMEKFLRQQLPERTWKNRLVRQDGQCYMEFGPLDVERLNRLGIQPDKLGPKLVACIWDEESPLEIGGYLVVDNLAMGRPSMGGIRMLPDITPAAVHNLARGMTLKNAAANLPYGGGKAGIIASPNLPPAAHAEVVRRFARLLYRYRDIYLPGPDVGTNDADMKLIAIENGLDNALSKPADMGGNRIDQLGSAGGGLIIAIQALLKEMPRLRALPQFANLQTPQPHEVTVMLQGFGAVGAHAARILEQQLPGARLIGLSDTSGYLYSPRGLPTQELFDLWRQQGTAALPFYQTHPDTAGAQHFKYSNAPEDLLRENVFCFIPAAPVANYLDTEASTQPTLTVERMGSWQLIVEGANTYSPDPARKAARARMERAVYRQKGILIATDYLVNSGGVIYAAQENLIRTPGHLRIPDEMLGNAGAVEKWLKEHAEDLSELAERRLQAAETYRQEVISRNMRELVDLLVADADLLPCEAAEEISVQRMAVRESKRTAADVMERAITVPVESTVSQAAALAVETGSPILIVTGPNGELAGVVTDWDMTRATAESMPADTPLNKLMTRQVISAAPEDSILELVRKLEYHEISSLPVVHDGAVVGMITTDLLARRSLYPLLMAR